jgi:hypothetical protein
LSASGLSNIRYLSNGNATDQVKVEVELVPLQERHPETNKRSSTQQNTSSNSSTLHRIYNYQEMQSYSTQGEKPLSLPFTTAYLPN